MLVNGQYVTGKGGEFQVNVSLSKGANTVIIEVIDGAGNVRKRSVDINYSPPPPSNLAAIILMVVLLAVVLLLGYQIGTARLPDKKAPDEHRTGPETKAPGASPMESETGASEVPTARPEQEAASQDGSPEGTK